MSSSSRAPNGYHRSATGLAADTAAAHSAPQSLVLYGACFCPFVQRVWIALELKGIAAYQYIEVDPYAKPKSLTDINPRGLVPALRRGEWGGYESTVLMEFLEDAYPSSPLLPATPEARAHSRLWTDHVNRHILPSFYAFLQAQETSAQKEHAATLSKHLTTLIDAADSTGPFFLGDNMTFVDVQLAPWALRFRRVLSVYRGWPAAEEESRWGRWLAAMENEEAVKRTLSGDQLYVDSYERYAENRPGTSQVAEAINAGRGLP